MIEIAFPEHRFKIKQVQNRNQIFDEFRKQWMVLTPEEWVRQNFLQYMVQVMHYPASLIAVEREVMLGELKKRFDIVVFSNSQPWMIVECKELNVPLTDSTLRQVLNYNISLQVQYLVITNGKQTFAVSLHGTHYTWLTELPAHG